MKWHISLHELLAQLTQRQVSPADVIHFYQQRIQRYNPQLRALISAGEDHVEYGDKQGSWFGIPYARKDNICLKHHPTTAGSNILSSYRAPYNATVINRLQAEGLSVIGRANMDEFAMGSSGEFSAYGPSHNPWDLSRTPGGSSAGSAAAVAGGLVPFALGSETGGSVRQPAAFCNLVAMYPSYGRVSRYGLIAFASSNDQIAPITRTVRDNAMIMNMIGGADHHDASMIQESAPVFTQDLSEKLPHNLRVGVLEESFHDAIDPEIRTALDRSIQHLASLGAQISTVKLPSLQYGIAVYFIMCYAEAASNLSRYDGSLYGQRSALHNDLMEMYITTRHDGFGNEVKRRILLGNYVLSAGQKDAYYHQAARVRAMIRHEFTEAFKNVDVLVSPTTTTLPFKLKELINDPIALYLGDYFTVPNCMIGTPAISLPCGLSRSNLPIGFQILGPRMSEALLYRVAYAFEQTTSHHTNIPNGYD